MKALSNDLQMALAGAGGAVAGVGVGAAAFGINAMALGPGALIGVVVLCVKGVSLSKKATRNIREAKQLEKDIEKILAYHSQLRISADKLFHTMTEIRSQYLSHLSMLKALVSKNTDYKTYTKDEKLLVRNSIMLVTLMHEMCKVTLVQRAKNEADIETINEKGVLRAVENAHAIMPKIKPISVLLDT